MESEVLKHHHWRKSGQWMGLNRKHAELVVNDTLAKDAFRECALETTRISCCTGQTLDYEAGCGSVR